MYLRNGPTVLSRIF